MKEDFGESMSKEKSRKLKDLERLENRIDELTEETKTLQTELGMEMVTLILKERDGQ